LRNPGKAGKRRFFEKKRAKNFIRAFGEAVDEVFLLLFVHKKKTLS
jgi:hypothetical protein